MPRNPADQSRPPPDHQKELLKLFGSLAYPLCRMMAKMTLGGEEDVRARIAARGFVRAQEP
jgi:hypothetical protein